MEVRILSKDSPDKAEVAELFYDYFKERHSDVLHGRLSGCHAMIDCMLDNNQFIYYVVKQGIPVGFITLSINDQYGMVTSHLVCDYMYVHPKHRGTMVTTALFTTGAHVALSLGYNMIGSTLIGSSNINNTRHTGGEEFSRSYYYDMVKFKPIYERYMKKLKFT